MIDWGAREIVDTLQMACVFLMVGGFAFGWLIERRRGMSPEESWGVRVMILSWMALVALIPIDFVIALWMRDWATIVIDTIVVIWLWWEFFGRNGKWKKHWKRIKEKVAVIKGRLKVVPVPAPA